MTARRRWTLRAAAALGVAAGVNLALGFIDTEHDPLLVSVLALGAVAVAGTALDATSIASASQWPRVGRVAALSGEDVRTSILRRTVDDHLTGRPPNNDAIWLIADLARRRVRQLHGVRIEDDPRRVEQLVGAELAEWMSHDRRHRYEPDTRPVRHTAAELSAAIRRIEDL